ncbi:hypothetical protein BY458DRAFT_489413 [Sporodiniella umbellata]|nr:hypothetical protein BY458DRAFT_489413 [Sporodiniella umbellata]
MTEILSFDVPRTICDIADLVNKIDQLKKVSHALDTECQCQYKYSRPLTDDKAAGINYQSNRVFFDEAYPHTQMTGGRGAETVIGFPYTTFHKFIKWPIEVLKSDQVIFRKVTQLRLTKVSNGNLKSDQVFQKSDQLTAERYKTSTWVMSTKDHVSVVEFYFDKSTINPLLTKASGLAA